MKHVLAANDLKSHPVEPQDEKLLHEIQRRAFAYFLDYVNPQNGLIADASRDQSPASIAAVGMALSSYPVAVERSFWSRAQALQRALTTLRFFVTAPQNSARDSSGYHGFFYHFLDRQSGRRAGRCELSSIDTALLLYGVLTAAAYFNEDTPDQRELREHAQTLLHNVDWRWMCAGQPTPSHGWKPERGFLKAHWSGYNEALLLMILALGAPVAEHALPVASYEKWLQTYQWKKIYDYQFVYAGPLFIHQFPHIWLDLRGLRDRFMREHDSDYFENSRRAVLIQREYARRNPRGFVGYGENCWGLSASAGPGPDVRVIAGRERRFYDYRARGVPFGPDDGTLSPWCAAACLPLAPAVVWPAIRNFVQLELAGQQHSIEETFNATYPEHHGSRLGWVSSARLGLDQGPLVLMIENYRSGLLWKLLRTCPFIQIGLRRADFQGGWLQF